LLGPRRIDAVLKIKPQLAEQRCSTVLESKCLDMSPRGLRKSDKGVHELTVLQMKSCCVTNKSRMCANFETELISIVIFDKH
jgi:hypothetical protein